MKQRNWWVKSLLAAGVLVGSAQTASADLIVTFTNQTWAGFNFTDFMPTVAPLGVVGTLTAVSVNATLNSSVNFTYADDLCVYVDPAPLSVGGLMQAGGFSNLGATERYFWANGGSDLPGTTVIDSVTLTTPLVFTGTVADPLIWVGNGYSPASSSGNWTGSIRLIGVDAVPEPTALLLSTLGLGLAGFGLGRRRRK